MVVREDFVSYIEFPACPDQVLAKLKLFYTERKWKS